MEGGGEEQSSLTREQQNPSTAVPRMLSLEVGSQEWVLLAYSATKLAALTTQAVVREQKQDAKILKHCLAELDIYKVTKIKILINIRLNHGYKHGRDAK